jgi:membrane-associated phospholipid phosphatase
MNAVNLRRADYGIWGAIFVIAAIVLIFASLNSFTIVLPSFSVPALFILGLVLTTLFYKTWRPDEGIADALTGTSQVVAFASVGAPLSYIAASANYPLWDAQFNTLDLALGLNWKAWLAFMNDLPHLHVAFALAYASFAMQTTVVAMVLGVGGHRRHLRIFVMTFMLTTLVVIGVSAVMPAQGTWGYLHLSLSDCPSIVPMTRDQPLAVFFGLRDGTYRQLVGTGSEGVISFPSLHAALGLLFIFALWPVKYIRWVALVVNLLLIFATPVEGSHYFTDVFAGLAIVALSWLVVSSTLAGRGISSGHARWTSAAQAVGGTSLDM